MGMWFYAIAGGEYLGGLIGQAAGAPGDGEAGGAKALILEVYSNVGWIGLGVGLLVLSIAPFVKRLIQPDTHDAAPH